MTGAPFINLNHKKLIESGEGETLWEELVRKSESGHMITTGSYTGTGNDQDSNEDGLPFNHAFSIMNVLTVVDDEKVEHRLVCMRNPWGSERWKGDWSDLSGRWTESLREQADHTRVNDGKFYMSFEDYLEQLEYTDFNVDVTDLHYASFALFGDDTPLNPTEVFGDGVIYNVHKMIL